MTICNPVKFFSQILPGMRILCIDVGNKRVGLAISDSGLKFANPYSILKRNKFEKYLTFHGIEYRRGNAGGGNQLRQPYLKKYRKIIQGRKFKNVERVHFFGYYIGNYPYLSKNKLEKLIQILNKFKFKS